MSNDSRACVVGEVPRVDGDTIELRMRERIRATIEAIVEEELVAALGAGRSSGPRSGEGTGAAPRQDPDHDAGSGDLRNGEGTCRNCDRHSEGMAERDHPSLRAPHVAAGRSHSGRVPVRGKHPPDPRCTRSDGPLSKDAVSRLVGPLAQDFAAWSERDLAGEAARYLIQDGWYPKVRIG
jgi:hypothetical protein